MNWLKKKPVLLSITLLLTACSTPYKPYGFSGGYQDEKTADNNKDTHDYNNKDTHDYTDELKLK